MIDRLQILKDTAHYSASAVAAQAVGLAAGVWSARALGPADFGVWNAVSLLLVYGAFMDLGVLAAMGRDLPYRLGRGDGPGATTLEGAARWATAAGALLAAAAVTACSFSPELSVEMRLGLRIMAATLVLQQIYTYHRTVLRARNRFSELSRQQLLLAVMTGLLVFALVSASGLAGRFVAAIIAQALILAYALYRHPWRRVATPDRQTLSVLMRVGIPITLSGAIASLVNTIDRPLVFAFLGDAALGYLGLGLMLTGLVALVPAMANQVLYPRITYRFGQSGRDVATLRPFVLTPPVVLACLLPFVIGPAFLLLPAVITGLLPAYEPGLGAMRIVVVGIFFYAILGLTDYFLVTIGKLKQYALFACIALVLNIAFDYAALRLGFGIEGVAFAGTLLTYFIYSTVVIGYALSHFSSSAFAWARYFPRLWAPFCYMLALLWSVEWAAAWLLPVGEGVGLLLRPAAAVAVYLAAASPLALVAAKEAKFDLSSIVLRQRSAFSIG